MPPPIVEPVREIPGNRASDSARPILIDCHQDIFAISSSDAVLSALETCNFFCLFFKTSEKYKIPAFKIKNPEMILGALNSCLNFSSKRIPNMPTGIVATMILQPSRA